MSDIVSLDTLFGSKISLSASEVSFRPSAYAIIVAHNNVLLAKTKSSGKFFFPGVGIESYETCEAALRREILEEAGIEVQVGELVHFKQRFFYYDPLKAGWNVLMFFYVCSPRTTEILPTIQQPQGEETETPEWVSITNVSRETFVDGLYDDFVLILKKLHI
jgi:8-oxo-dGTP pyrophosphatase MutT (NUDIX family)